MNRFFLLILCAWTLSLSAQELPLTVNTPALNAQNRSGTDLNIGMENVAGKKITAPVNVTTNMIGQLSATEPAGASATNQVAAEKAGFLLSTGLEYADEGEYEDAEKAYLRALAVDPDSEDIQFRLGTLYVSMKRYKDAVRIFERLVVQHPENPLTHNNLAWCYATGPGVRNVTLALRHAREALLYAPNAPSMWNTLAEAYYLSGDYQKALRSSDQALDLLQSSEAPAKESLESFQLQRSKIMRAEQAFKVLEGLDEED